MTISEWLDHATLQLHNIGITSARLDAEVLASHTLKKPRTWLHAHADEALTPAQYDIVTARLDLRLDRVPVAYIVGHKEFYGRSFRVTTSTLIPRPESEEIIELLTTYIPSNATLLPEPKHLVDIGTGSGCLGITAKLEHPELDVTLIDIDKHALKVAKKNAVSLDANVHLLESNLLESYPLQASYVIANLPYVDPSWIRSPETNHEPALALFAKDNGLHLIKRLLTQLSTKLSLDGLAFIEADPCQHEAIKSFAIQHRLQHKTTAGYCIVLELAL